MAEADDKVELSRADFNILKAGYDTLNTLWNNPKHGLSVKRAIKELKPDTAIPELDIAERYAKPLEDKLAALEAENKKTREEIEADKKTRADEKELNNVYAEIDAFVKKKNMTDEGRAGLIELMKKRQIRDVEVAGTFYLDSLPKPKPVHSGGGVLPQHINPLDPFKEQSEDAFKPFWENPIKAQDDMIAQILNEEPQAA